MSLFMAQDAKVYRKVENLSRLGGLAKVTSTSHLVPRKIQTFAELLVTVPVPEILSLDALRASRQFRHLIEISPYANEIGEHTVGDRVDHGETGTGAIFFRVQTRNEYNRLFPELILI